MLGLRVSGGLLLAALWLLDGCGGGTTPGPDGEGGAGNTADGCVAGAGGEAGERPLEAYARLRTACGLNAKVNRRGESVGVDYHIR